MIVVGMISGTSADGIEVAVIDVSGAPQGLAWRLLSHVHVPYAPGLQDEVFTCFRPESGTVDRLCGLNFALGRAFAAAVLAGIAAAGLQPEQVDLVGSHGQTLWHVPEGSGASTLQLGEPAVIAQETGITTVSSFRARDMAAGGQGAPLVPHLDRVLLTHPAYARAAQNIGGIANVTYLPPLASGEEILAFDTGPGNMLIDYAARRATGGAWHFDRDGALAAQGRVHEGLLAGLLQDAYLQQSPPKTTGRELYGAQYGAQVWDRAMAAGLEPVDVVATLTAFTARSIAGAYRQFLPQLPREAIVSGGGAQNQVLMAMLAEALAPCAVLRSDDIGLPAEGKEAIAFAILAYETWHGRPGNVPAATGARDPVVLGNITPGRRSLRLEHAPGQGRTPAGAAPQAGSDGSALPLTEERNPASERIDSMPALEIARLMNAEDAGVPAAVADELPAIARAIDGIAERLRAGGRLIYAGAGTSGRLAVLDAAECPPTFSTPPGQVVALIAGGAGAQTAAVEGAEDDREAGRADLKALNAGARDAVVGIAASGRTPYVLGVLEEARARGALTIGLASSRPSPMADLAEVMITPLVGPEVITGSTRLKAGTAQKMVLNMLSTGAMIGLGKTFGNLMVDVRPTNAKLKDRACRIVQSATGVPWERAAELLALTGGEVKTAIVCELTGRDPEEARRLLTDAGGVVRAALERAAGRPDELRYWD